RLVLAKSGTGILEVAHHAIPLVVLYRVRRPLASLARFSLCTPWFASINLIANREVVPEFCFDGDGSEAAIAERAATLLADGPDRSRSTKDLQEVRLGFDSPGTAARAASAVLQALANLSA
ncbi:MAG TPA: lipid-A-disaccharide synthase, partial [Planctomycetota bacterium]|nr:lipid-A-disaccharide synthase [Planctomycetota bacterium]